ncbi:cupin domain-containing protein [Candidatus Omnitrophota bacterium]
MKNLFKALPDASYDEIFDVLLQTKGVTIERIVSQGQSTPKGKWLVDEKEEWVTLLQGSAVLIFEGETAPFQMTSGDYIHIPKGQRHRVEETDKNQKSVWLAVKW